VPSLVLGWSHKYREMAAEFDAGIPVLDFSSFSADTLFASFRETWQRREQTRARLQAKRMKVKASAEQNFELVANYLRQAHEARFSPLQMRPG
jgi:polysaccharide pyruvyl transferase WcaK-like protein